jgi:hypothetical protein
MTSARAIPIAGLLAVLLVVGIAAGLPSAGDGPSKRFSQPLTIAIDGGYAAWSETEAAERAELGAPVTRHEWFPEEPIEAQDELVEVAASQVHTRIHALLGGNELGDPTHYREWVIEFIERYGRGGSFWDEHPELDESRFAITSIELGNEPYLGEMSAEEYADAVLPTLEEIEAQKLPVKVVLPSGVYGDDSTWVETLYGRIPDLDELFHAFAVHPYWYGHAPTEEGPFSPLGQIETLREQMDEQGAEEKPIWITEYGQSTAECGEECVSEEDQAEHLEQMLAAVVANPEWGVEMLSIFQLRDRGTASGDRELQFGLLREDGSPKPAYDSIRTALRLTR